MSAYLSTLLTQTTTKYNSIKRTLLKDENDGDSEADSHISRVLIAYYNEKPEAEWPSFLPQEARKAPQQSGAVAGAVGAGYAAIWGGQQQQQPQQGMYGGSSSGTPNMGSPQMGYGNSGAAGGGGGGGGGGSLFNARPGALDDLWDSAPRPSSSRTLPGHGGGAANASPYGQSPIGGGSAYSGGGYQRPGAGMAAGTSPPSSSHSMGGPGGMGGMSGMSASERLKAKYRR